MVHRVSDEPSSIEQVSYRNDKTKKSKYECSGRLSSIVDSMMDIVDGIDNDEMYGLGIVSGTAILNLAAGSILLVEHTRKRSRVNPIC